MESFNLKGADAKDIELSNNKKMTLSNRQLEVCRYTSAIFYVSIWVADSWYKLWYISIRIAETEPIISYVCKIAVSLRVCISRKFSFNTKLSQMKATMIYGEVHIKFTDYQNSNLKIADLAHIWYATWDKIAKIAILNHMTYGQWIIDMVNICM